MNSLKMENRLHYIIFGLMLLIIPKISSSQTLGCKKHIRAALTDSQNLLIWHDYDIWEDPSNQVPSQEYRTEFTSIKLSQKGVLGIRSDGQLQYITIEDCRFQMYEPLKYPKIDQIGFKYAESGSDESWGITLDGRLRIWGGSYVGCYDDKELSRNGVQNGIISLNEDFPGLLDNSGQLPRDAVAVKSYSNSTVILTKKKLHIIGDDSYPGKAAYSYTIDLKQYSYTEVVDVDLFPLFVSPGGRTTATCDGVAILALRKKDGEVQLIPINYKHKGLELYCGEGHDKFDFSVLPMWETKYWEWAREMTDMLGDNGHKVYTDVVYVGRSEIVMLAGSELCFWQREFDRGSESDVADVGNEMLFNNKPWSFGKWGYYGTHPTSEFYLYNFNSSPFHEVSAGSKPTGENLSWEDLAQDVVEVCVCQNSSMSGGYLESNDVIILREDGTIWENASGEYQLKQVPPFEFKGFLNGRSPLSSQKIQLKPMGTVWMLPLTLNGEVFDFVFDTGASGISLSLEDFNFLKSKNKISESDFVVSSFAMLADGSEIEKRVYNAAKVNIGETVLRGQEVSVANSSGAPNLLGQSVLKEFDHFKFDSTTGILILYK